MVDASAATAGIAAAHFATGRVAEVEHVEAMTVGHIHNTWRVTSGGSRWVLQRLNTNIFTDPDALMANLSLLAAHLPSVVGPVPTRDGDLLWRDDGSVWRLFAYLEGTSPPRAPHSPAISRSLGRAFGAFHKSVESIDPGQLIEVLPGLHDPGSRLAQFDTAVRADPVARVGACSAEVDTVKSIRWVGDLAAGMRCPQTVPMRIAHFDAKADNVLFDNDSGDVRAIIDLDTVMAGSVLWDVGDLIRSVACPVAEDAENPAEAVVDLDAYGAIVAGYLDAGPALTPAEHDGLGIAALVVTFEQAVRFLTDHLAGDQYYRVLRGDHNLARARVQLRLLQSMIEQRNEIAGMISAL